MQETSLNNIPNIGKELHNKLIQVGINSYEDLKAVGTEQTFLRIKAIDPGACYCLLCGLQGAVEGIRWHHLAPEKKQELKAFFDMTKKL